MAPNYPEMDMDKALRELGAGPMRFAPKEERSTAEQINALTESERTCFDNLKRKWEESNPPFSDEMYLRFARCSPGKDKFKEAASYKVMKSFSPRYLSLTATDLQQQLLTKVSSVWIKATATILDDPLCVSYKNTRISSDDLFCLGVSLYSQYLVSSRARVTICST